MIVSSKVTHHYKQVPLVEYLASRFTYRTADEWLLFVQDGRISVNNQPSNNTTIVTQGDVVRCDLPDPPMPTDVNFNYTIVYEDEWLIGIDKPPNLRVHDNRRYIQANLIYHLHHTHQPPYPAANLINRLDKDTSGVILLSRDTETHIQMQALFREKIVQKEYLAVVHGVPREAAGVIELPIGKLESLPGVHRYGVDAKNGKTAVTHYQTIETYNEQYSLLKLQPQTGRTHQLRVHCQTLGHPIVGDKLYQMSDEAFLAWVQTKEPLPNDLISRQALHSVRTSFIHPHTKRPCSINAPLPQDMQILRTQLNSHKEISPHK